MRSVRGQPAEVDHPLTEKMAKIAVGQSRFYGYPHKVGESEKVVSGARTFLEERGRDEFPVSGLR